MDVKSLLSNHFLDFKVCSGNIRCASDTTVILHFQSVFKASILSGMCKYSFRLLFFLVFKTCIE